MQKVLMKCRYCIPPSFQKVRWKLELAARSTQRDTRVTTRQRKTNARKAVERMNVRAACAVFPQAALQSAVFHRESTGRHPCDTSRPLRAAVAGRSVLLQGCPELQTFSQAAKRRCLGSCPTFVRFATKFR